MMAKIDPVTAALLVADYIVGKETDDHMVNLTQLISAAGQ